MHEQEPNINCYISHNHGSLHLFDFWKKTFFFKSCLSSFFSLHQQKLLGGAPNACMIDCTCTDSHSKYTLPPQSSLQKAREVSHSYTQNHASSKEPTQKNFLTTGDYFEHNTLRYNARLAEERKESERKKGDE